LTELEYHKDSHANQSGIHQQIDIPHVKVIEGFSTRFKDRVFDIYARCAYFGLLNEIVNWGDRQSVRSVLKSDAATVSDIRGIILGMKTIKETLEKRYSNQAPVEKGKDLSQIHPFQKLSETPDNIVGPRLKMSSSTTLRFDDVIPDSYVFLVEIQNTEVRFENTARNVSAAIEFQPIKGETLKSEGAWKYACPGSCDKWTKQIQIYMGRAACLPLFFWFQTSQPFKYYQVDARKLIINHHGLLTGTKDFDLLRLGEWKIRIRLTGDNIDEQCDLTVNLSPDQGPRRIP